MGEGKINNADSKLLASHCGGVRFDGALWDEDVIRAGALERMDVVMRESRVRTRYIGSEESCMYVQVSRSELESEGQNYIWL